MEHAYSSISDVEFVEVYELLEEWLHMRGRKEIVLFMVDWM